MSVALSSKGCLASGVSVTVPVIDQRGADILRGNILIIGQRLRLHYNLKVAEAGAVIEFDKAEALEVRIVRTQPPTVTVCPDSASLSAKIFAIFV